MFNFIENPGISNGCPSDHDTIYAIFFAVGQRFFGAVYITIAKYRYMDSRVVFDFRKITPIRFTFIHLLSGPGMDADSLNPYVLKSFYHFLDPDGVFIPA